METCFIFNGVVIKKIFIILRSLYYGLPIIMDKEIILGNFIGVLGRVDELDTFLDVSLSLGQEVFASLPTRVE